MHGILRGEIRKLTTIRASHMLVLAAVAVVALAAASTTMSVDPQMLTGPLSGQFSYHLTSIVLSGFGLVIGVRAFTDEFRHGTATWTFLGVTARVRVLLAKAATAALAAATMTALSLAAMVGTAVALAGIKGGNLGVTPGDLGAFGGLVIGVAALAAIGAGVGALVRNQLVAVVGAVIWVGVVENVASGFLRSGARFLPGQAVHAIGGVVQASNIAPIPVAAVLLFGYLVITAAMAAIALDRRDVL